MLKHRHRHQGSAIWDKFPNNSLILITITIVIINIFFTYECVIVQAGQSDHMRGTVRESKFYFIYLIYQKMFSYLSFTNIFDKKIFRYLCFTFQIFLADLCGKFLKYLMKSYCWKEFSRAPTQNQGNLISLQNYKTPLESSSGGLNEQENFS